MAARIHAVSFFELWTNQDYSVTSGKTDRQNKGQNALNYWLKNLSLESHVTIHVTKRKTGAFRLP